MNKTSEKFIIQITCDPEDMIHKLLALISNGTFQKNGDRIIVNTTGKVIFDFQKENVEIVLESKK